VPAPKTLAGLLLVIASVAGCSDNDHRPRNVTTEPKTSAMTKDVSIKLGEMGPSFAKRYPLDLRIQHQPAGLDFYEIDWDQKAPGSVRIENGKSSFTIENVLGVQATQELGELEFEGLKDFTLFAGISEPDRISHDEARLQTYALLRRFADAGWKATTPRSRPRLRDQARLDYALNVSSSVGLDPNWLPTFEEWMRIQSRTPWSFYANGLYMDVSFTRERTLTDPKKPGSYLLTFNIKTETEYFRGYAGPDNRLRWKELVPQELAKVAALRSQKETELRAKGVPIDESYQDPPVPSLK
jgi:hypothetical protein